ncbi:MAG: amino acid adenylation domain-containing protein [Verrucomicrobiales bacterium]|nr:amino acid adenylation domain-containing protein [Verrucomicrobiales bacterium]
MIEVISDYPRNKATSPKPERYLLTSFSKHGLSDERFQNIVAILIHYLSGQNSFDIGHYSDQTPSDLKYEIAREDSCSAIVPLLVGNKDHRQFSISFQSEANDYGPSFEAVFEYLNGECTIVYDSKLYLESTIKNWGARLDYLASQVSSNPNLLVKDVDLFLPGELDEMIHGWNPSEHERQPYYRQLDYPSLFEKQAKETPDRIAVSDAEKSWTYRELNSFSNAVARKLLDQGIATNERIGLHVERSAEMLGAMIGIMKAGGGYVPLEPGLPDERMTYMAEDSGIKLAVSQKQFQSIPLFGKQLDTIWLEDIPPGNYHPNPDHQCSPNDLIYVIYTSGSTGKPKGMEIEHHSMVNYVYANIERHGITEDDIYLGSTTIAFDVSVPELFCPLVLGGEVHVAPAKIAADGEALGELIDKAGITMMNATPTTFQILVASGWKGKEDLVIMSGGEAISPDLANTLQGLCKAVYNEYGPCEATVFNTVHKVDHESGTVPLGTPLLNSRIYILDDDNQPVPPSIRGRIFIGGDCVVRGYIDRPELNEERFLTDPFLNGGRMYDTGDVGYWRDGVLYYSGRSDNQVKIRGYRIELGEIENELNAHPGVQEVAVLVREDQPGQKRIVAYLQPAATMPTQEELQEFLLNTLPPYMVPTWFVEMENFPKTVSGKIDRLSLPVPEAGNSIPVEPENTSDDLAKEIAGLWREVLNVQRVKTTDILFRLGADSINAVQFQKKLTDHLRRKIPIATIFQCPTSEHLADVISDNAQPVESDITKTKVGNDIAIIGMAGRFPGAPNIDTYWDNLVNGVESIETFSNEELESFGVSAADYLSPNYVPRGTSLEDAYQFDPAFFGLSGAEAEVMDPQARLFLKTVWETLENAGYPGEPAGSRIGVYAGGGYSTYQFAHLGIESVNRLNTLTGNASDYIATRSAFTFGLTGPAVSVQTACSTSLVAVNEACEAIRANRCEMAIAGGVSFSYPHEQGYHYDEGLIFSKDGHCRPFDKAASGTIFSQGAGAVLLKPLSRAIEDGDTIHAVIKGIAINNDGDRKGTFASPSISGQTSVVSAALENSGISADEISYVEAHGTGTVIGDPIEIAGLTTAWRYSSDRIQDCPIGSVKSNIGHADAAAGIAGLLKLALSLKHQTIPGTLNFTEENPEMDLENSPFYIQDETTPWETDGQLRIGAVSAMGLGGTNAHAILAEAPATESAPSQDDQYLIVPFSAKSRTSLEGTLSDWKQFVAGSDLNWADAAFTMQNGRGAFDVRFAIVGNTPETILSELENRDIKISGAPVIDRNPVFMFTGQGSQYRGMAEQSYRSDNVFRSALDQCFKLLKQNARLDLEPVLFGDDKNLINETRYAQPAIFAVCYAQSQRWLDWGFEPTSLIGHSIGEYVAAVISGVMSLSDALTIVAKRGQLMQEMKPGKMMAVFDTAENVAALIEQNPTVEVAAVNGPSLTVVAGTEEGIARFRKILQEKTVRHRELVTSHAFHSKMMEPMLDEFESAVAKIDLSPPQIPYISNVTGKWITAKQATSPGYYAKQIRRCVKFSAGVETIAAENPGNLFLEMGPGETLTTFCNDILSGTDHIAISTLPGPKTGGDSLQFTWKALAHTWTLGQSLNWSRYLPQEGRRRIPLPTYHFDEQTYRIEPNIINEDPAAQSSSIYHTPIWKESKSGYAGVPITPGEKTVWLCFINNRSSLERGILDAAKAETSRRITVATGKNYKRYSANRYRINPESEEDYESLVKSVINDFGTIGGVIHSWSCNHPHVKNDEKVWKSQTTRTISALWLAKALGSLGNITPIPVNFITTGLIRAKSDRLLPANHALAGAVGVIQREYPNLITRTIDLGDQTFDIRTEEALHKLLNGDQHHLKIAMKDGSWWLPAFENDDPDIVNNTEPVRELKNEGVYIFTGGLGGLALTIAKEFCNRANKLTLVLITRSAFPDRNEWASLLAGSDTDPKTASRIKTIEELEQTGARIQIVTADLSIPGMIESTFDAVQRQHEAIDGVIHTSGILQDGTIARKDKRSIENVFAAKVIPAQGIYHYFSSPNHNADFVVLFSSVSTELAAYGQSDYAAANAYLDGIAEQAYSEGHPFFSISWPAWREVGMAAETSSDAAKASGLSLELANNSVAPEIGAKAFFDIVSFSDSGRTVVSVLPFDHHYHELLAKRQPASNRSDESRSKIEAPVEQMLSLWKRELKNNQIEEDHDYFELGGDSLQAVGLLQRIQETFDQAIPMSLLIKAPTAKQLVQAMGLDSGGIEEVEEKELPAHIIPLRIERESNETPMFCIHAADGSVMFYQGFATRLKHKRTIYGVESRFFHDESYEIEANIEAMAERYLKDIKEVRPEGPYIFAGYSFGALVATRMAQLARQRGDEVEGLIIYDMFNPEVIRKYSIFERAKVIWDSRSILPFWPRLGSCFERVGELAKWAAIHLISYLKYKTKQHEGEYARHVEARYMNESLIPDFRPEPYEGRVMLVLTEDPGDRYDFGEIHGWRKVLTGQLTHRFVTGNHLEIFTGTHLELLVNHTDYFLQRVPPEKYPSPNSTREKMTVGDERFKSSSRQTVGQSK